MVIVQGKLFGKLKLQDSIIAEPSACSKLMRHPIQRVKMEIRMLEIRRGSPKVLMLKEGGAMIAPDISPMPGPTSVPSLVTRQASGIAL